MITLYSDTLLKKFNLCVELKRTRLESLSHISSISLQFPHNSMAGSVRFRHLRAFHCQLTVNGNKKNGRDHHDLSFHCCQTPVMRSHRLELCFCL